MVRVIVFHHITDLIRKIKEVLNIEGFKNCMIDSKVTARLDEKAIFLHHNFFVKEFCFVHLHKSKDNTLNE